MKVSIPFSKQSIDRASLQMYTNKVGRSADGGLGG